MGVCVSVCPEIYFAEFTYTIRESKSCSSNVKAIRRTPGEEPLLQFEAPKARLLAKFPLAGVVSVLCPIQAFSELDEAYLHYEEQSSLLKVH